MTRSHSSADIVKIIRSRSTPALLTRTSKLPYPSSAAARRLAPVDHSLTSPALTTASPPVALISSATVWTLSPGRSLSTSRAPARASAIDSARPSPLPAPVTIATLPSRVIAAPSVPRPAEDPAVGDELAARRVRGLVGGQEGHQPRDFDRLAEAGDGHRLEEFDRVDVGERLRRGHGHRGHHAAGVDGVDPDAELPELLRRGLGDAADRELAGAVCGQPGRADDALDRGHVDDGAAAGRGHRRDDRPDAQPRAHQVDVQYPAEFLHGNIDDRRGVKHAAVVLQDAERT